MNDCSLLDEFLAGDSACAAELERHVQTCESCREAVEQVQAIEMQLAAADAQTQPESAWLKRTEAVLRANASPIALPPVHEKAPGEQFAATKPSTIRSVIFRSTAVAAASVLFALAFRIPAGPSNGREPAQAVSPGGWDAAPIESTFGVSIETPSDMRRRVDHPRVQVVGNDRATFSSGPSVEGGSGYLVADLGSADPDIDLLMVLPVVPPERP